METTKEETIKVICDTNVWYRIADGVFVQPPNIILIQTSFTLFELVSTEKIARNPKYLQSVIKAINQHGKEIIPVNPYDFVIMNHQNTYLGNDKLTYNMLAEFSKVLNMDLGNDFKIDDDLKSKILEECKFSRISSKNFANACNEVLPEIRKKILATTGVKAHRKIDMREQIKATIEGFFDHYIKEQNIIFDTNTIDPNAIELFLAVTETYFKELETVKGMKVDRNDPTDWLNMLYVRPGYKYLTFEDSWVRYIKEDQKVKDYLYQPA